MPVSPDHDTPPQVLHEPPEVQAAIAERVRSVLLRFVNPLPIVTYVADASAPHLHFVSAGITQLLGYSRREWLDREFRVSRLHPDDRDRVVQLRERARREGEASFSCEYRILDRSDEAVWVRDAAMLLPDVSGVLSPPGAPSDEVTQQWWGYLLDLTEQRQAEEELRARAAQQAALARLGQRAQDLQDPARLLAEAAALVAETLGMERAAIVQRDRPGGPLRETFTMPFGAPGSALDVPSGSIAHRALDQEERVVVTHRRAGTVAEGAPLQHDSLSSAAVRIGLPGTRAAALVVESARPRPFTTDETGMLRSVSHILSSTLGRLSTEGQLGQALKLNALGRLSAGVAHDFNNILQAMMGFGTLLEPIVAHDEQGPAYLAELREAGQRAMSLTEQLLSFAREQPIAPVPLDLVELVDGMEPMMARLLGSDVALRHERAAAPARVEADRHQLEQVLLNLVVNARDAMPAGGSIIVRTRAAEWMEPVGQTAQLPLERYVVLEVEDAGIGMDQAQVERVFEPFFTTKAAEGTGLGLSTVLGIVKRHGGAVAVDSTLGRGSRFTVFLPALGKGAPAAGAGGAAAAAAGGAAAGAGAGSPSAVGGGTDGAAEGAAAAPSEPPVAGPPERSQPLARIVVVDDQESIRTVLRKTLAQQGYAVTPQGDAEGCLAAVRADPSSIDLLITDVRMPGVGGVELARRLHELRPDVPVLYMSGYPEVTLDDGESVGVLRKPFSISELVEAVAEALGA